MVGVRKSDVFNLDFLDAEELQTDGSFVYLTVTVVSTTSGTSTVVINTPADGEGIITGRDHPVKVGDLVDLTGTSGGLGDGTFTVATVATDLSFTVVESIGTSTGGSVDFRYVPGAQSIGYNPIGQNTSAETNLQGALTDVSNDALLDGDPGRVDTTYSVTYTGGYATQEMWINTGNSRPIKQIDYSYTGNKVSSEVRVVFAESDGTTIIAQKTITYAYSGNIVTGATATRDV